MGRRVRVPPTPIGTFSAFEPEDDWEEPLAPRQPIPVRDAQEEPTDYEVRGRLASDEDHASPEPVEELAGRDESRVEPGDSRPKHKAEQSSNHDESEQRRQLRDALLDLERAKERLRKDSARELRRREAELVKKLLPVLDNLDRTIDAAENHNDSPSTEALLQGVRIVRDQFLDVLKDMGLEPIDARNSRFDPAQHEAVGVVPVSSEEQDGFVLEVLQPGYKLGEDLLRPAMVRVGKLAAAS